MSKLLRNEMSELKQDSNTVKQRLRVIANKLLNSNEVSVNKLFVIF